MAIPAPRATGVKVGVVKVQVVADTRSYFGQMSGLYKVAILNSHLLDLKRRVDGLVQEQIHERVESFQRIEQLEQKLRETEAALGDAERELLFVKNTAITAIRKLGVCTAERDAFRNRVNILERDALNAAGAAGADAMRDDEWEAV